MAFYDPEVWIRLDPYIREQMRVLSEKMCLGGCKSWESYCEAVGRYRAFDTVLKEADHKSTPPDDLQPETEDEDET